MGGMKRLVRHGLGLVLVAALAGCSVLRPEVATSDPATYKVQIASNLICDSEASFMEVVAFGRDKIPEGVNAVNAARGSEVCVRGLVFGYVVLVPTVRTFDVGGERFVLQKIGIFGKVLPEGPMQFSPRLLIGYHGVVPDDREDGDL